MTMQKTGSWIFRFGWALLALSSMYIALFTVIYFNFRLDVFFLTQKPQEILESPVWLGAFYIHIISSMFCLLAGPWQFLPSLRRRNIRLHRFLGKLYFVTVVFLAGPTGMYMAFFANGGIGTSIGFFLLSLGWIFTTFKAMEAIRNRNIAAHRAWMVRSFALTFSAVTLRVIWMPLLSQVFQLDHALVLVATSYLNWIPNLLFAEWLIRRKKAVV